MLHEKLSDYKKKRVCNQSICELLLFSTCRSSNDRLGGRNRMLLDQISVTLINYTTINRVTWYL